MKSILTLVLSFSLFSFSCGQSAPPASKSEKVVGGPCEGCEATLQYGDRILSAVDTLSDFFQEGPKIEITGTVLKADGKTPAPGVILYYYHTDQEGKYSAKAGATAWENRHGELRNWIKTDESGRYAIYTLRPASYPNSSIPAHIHVFVKEPCCSPYYIDDFYFNDDPFLGDQIRNRTDARGGSGVLVSKKTTNVTRYTRDIILGLNIPGY